MITIFNRRELLTTYEMNEQARVRELLSNNKIDYQVKTVNHMSSAIARSHMGSAGQKMEHTYQYIIYVRKEEYDKAAKIIGKESMKVFL